MGTLFSAITRPEWVASSILTGGSTSRLSELVALTDKEIHSSVGE